MSKTAKKADPREQKTGTSFSCHAPGAGVVCVAGTFNGWDPAATPLTRRADGTWAVTLDLPPGRPEPPRGVRAALCYRIMTPLSPAPCRLLTPRWPTLPFPPRALAPG